MSHHMDGERNLEPSNDWLISLLDKGVSLVSGLGPDFEHEAKKMSVLKDRLMDGRFHLAVLGQFKRGKSTLMQNVNISFARFASRIKERLEETVAAAQGAMKTANSRKKDHGETVVEELCRLEKVAGTLEALKVSLER